MRVFEGCRIKYVGDLHGMFGKHGTVRGKSLILPGYWKVLFTTSEDPVGTYHHLARWEFVVTSRKYKPAK
jgi:hypothetical protein